MLFKKAGAKHFVHLLLRIGLYYDFSYQKRAYCIYQESIKSPSPFMINGLTMPLVILL